MIIENFNELINKSRSSEMNIELSPKSLEEGIWKDSKGYKIKIESNNVKAYYGEHKGAFAEGENIKSVKKTEDGKLKIYVDKVRDNPMGKYMRSVDFGEFKIVSLKEELKAIKRG